MAVEAEIRRGRSTWIVADLVVLGIHSGPRVRTIVATDAVRVLTVHG